VQEERRVKREVSDRAHPYSAWTPFTLMSLYLHVERGGWGYMVVVRDLGQWKHPNGERGGTMLELSLS